MFVDLIGFLLVIVYLLFWGQQFIQLLLLGDSDLPGKYDKLCWTLIFILALPVSPILFVYWKGAYLALRQDERTEKHQDK
jgi:hypothetical protein